MAINLKSYPFDGPFSQTSSLRSSSGVYVILGKAVEDVLYTVIDIGESQSVRERVGNHDRALSWRCRNKPLFCAVYYCNEADRMKIEQELRAFYKPVCGER